MIAPERRHRRRMAIGALAASACVVTTLTGSASGDNVTQLKNKLGSAQSQLNGAKQREQTLSGSVAALNSRVSSLGTEISLVQSREAAARERLVTYEQRLAATRVALVRERRHLAHLRKVLDRAQSALKDELVSQYEQPQQSVVSLLVDSSGVQQLVNGLQYLSRAKQQEQSIITATRTARAAAQAGAARLTALQHGDAQAAGEASTQTNALAGMNALLNSRAGRACARARGTDRRAGGQPRARRAAAVDDLHDPEAGGRGRSGRSHGHLRRRRRPRPLRGLGDPVSDRALRVRRTEPPAQQRRRLGLLPDRARYLEGLRRQRTRRLPCSQVRAGRRRDEDLEQRRGRVELDLRRHRRHQLT